MCSSDRPPAFPIALLIPIRPEEIDVDHAPALVLHGADLVPIQVIRDDLIGPTALAKPLDVGSKLGCVDILFAADVLHL